MNTPQTAGSASPGSATTSPQPRATIYGVDPRWTDWDSRNLRSILQSNAATDVKKQQKLAAALEREDLLKLILEWGVSYVTPQQFRQQASGLGGVRRRVIDVWLEAGAGNSRSVQLYVDQGEDLERRAPNNRRRTALHCAVLGPSLECVSILLDAGASTEAKDMDKCTALHLAAQKGRADMVAVLLKHGADPFAEANDGSRPGSKFDVEVTEEGKSQVLALLPKKGDKAPVSPVVREATSTTEPVKNSKGCRCVIC